MRFRHLLQNDSSRHKTRLGGSYSPGQRQSLYFWFLIIGKGDGMSVTSDKLAQFEPWVGPQKFGWIKQLTSISYARKCARPLKLRIATTHINNGPPYNNIYLIQSEGSEHLGIIQTRVELRLLTSLAIITEQHGFIRKLIKTNTILRAIVFQKCQLESVGFFFACIHNFSFHVSWHFCNFPNETN